MAQELKCPNCGAGAVAKEGGGLVCTNRECGGSFTFQEGEARLKGVGEYEKLQGKVDKLEAHQAEIDELLGRAKPEEHRIPETLDGTHPDEEDLDQDEDDEEEDW